MVEMAEVGPLCERPLLALLLLRLNALVLLLLRLGTCWLLVTLLGSLVVGGS